MNKGELHINDKFVKVLSGYAQKCRKTENYNSFLLMAWRVSAFVLFHVSVIEILVSE